MLPAAHAAAERDGRVAGPDDGARLEIGDETVISRLGDLGTAPVEEDRATPEAHAEHLQSQIELWRPIIEEAGVTAG